MRRTPLLALYVTVFIDLLGFGIILPLLPYYAVRFGASGLGVGALLAAYSAMQFLGAPLLGRLSDRWGRRPILLLSLAGSALSLFVCGLADSLGVLLAARAMAGLFGGSISAAQAYIADSTEPSSRARYLGLLGASIGLGFVFGPALGAGLSGWGFGTAAFVASGLATANLVFTAAVLPESRRPVTTGPRARMRVGPLAVARALGHPRLGRIIGAMFLATFGFVCMEATFALLGQRHFGLTAARLGLVFTFLGMVMVVVQGGLVGWLTARFGEHSLAFAGALSMAVALLGLPLAPSLTVATIALAALAAGQALVSPTLTSLLSAESGAEAQGGTLGIGQSMGAAARAIGPLAAGALYDAGAALPYVVGAIGMLGAALLIAANRRTANSRVASRTALRAVQ